MSKKHICELCSSEFTVKSSLNLHKQQIHEKIRYSCEQCEKSYTSKQNLEQHMQSVHKKLKQAGAELGQAQLKLAIASYN